VTLSTSLISCCGELIYISFLFSCFSTPACGSVDLVCAIFGILFISLFSLIAHALQCFFTRNYTWRWIFQFFIATNNPNLFCTLLVWINVKWITTISLLQRKLCKQFLLMMEANHCNMVYLNFTLQCQHVDIFLSLTMKYSA